MKVVEKGYIYKVSNVDSGRQTIKFNKKGLVRDIDQKGTDTLELIKVLIDKFDYEKDLYSKRVLVSLYDKLRLNNID